MNSALRNSGKTQMVTGCIFKPAQYWTCRNNNLHHGPFLFRHKGRKVKGKPNYPPTKLIVKAHRHMRRKLPAELKATRVEDRRRAKRNWTEAIIANNDKLRPMRVRKRALGQRVPARLQALGVQ